MFPTYMSGKNGFGAILVVFGAILVGFEVILGVLGRFWRIRKKRPGEWVSFYRRKLFSCLFFFLLCGFSFHFQIFEVLVYLGAVFA